MFAALTLAGSRRRSREWRRCHPAGQFTAALGVLLLLPLAACYVGMAPDTSAPPGHLAPVVVTIASTVNPVVGGEPLHFRISVSPAPHAGLTVRVMIAAPDCKLVRSLSVPIAAGEPYAELTVPTPAAGAKRCVVTATIAAGEGYEVDAAGGASATTALTMRLVAITPDSADVTEGEPVSFTLTATPPPTSDLAVNVSLSESGSFLAASGPRTVTIPASAPTATLSADTVDDGAAEPDGWVTATVETGSGYEFGAQAAATVAVADNDTTRTAPTGPTQPRSTVVPEVTITTGATTVTEGERVPFDLSLDPAPGSALTVNLQWEDPGGFLSQAPPETVTVSPSYTAGTQIYIREPTVNDGASEADASVTVTVGAGTGYVAGAVASIVVKDNDSRSVTISMSGARRDEHVDSSIYATVSEGDTITFTLTATPVPESPLPVRLSWTLESVGFD